MIVTIEEILAKIEKLPPDYAEHVHRKGNTAEVNSFSKPTQEEPWIASIRLAKEDGKEAEDKFVVNCTCPARALCVHIAAFYAVAKGIKPKASEEKPKVITGKKKEAKEIPSEEIEDKETGRKYAERALAEIDKLIAALDAVESSYKSLAAMAKEAKEFWEKMKGEK